jgi:hypothetical protein
MAIWNWLGNVSCNRQGNQVAFDLVISDLGFLPSPSLSSADVQKVRAIATWRRDESESQPLFLRPRTANEPRLLAVRIVSVSGVSTECTVRVVLRFNPFNLLSLNAEGTQTSGGYPAVALRGFAAGFLTLKQGSNSAESPTLDDVALPDVFPIEITSEVAAAGVGRLPGWDESSGPLDLFAESIAERIERSSPGQRLSHSHAPHDLRLVQPQCDGRRPRRRQRDGREQDNLRLRRHRTASSTRASPPIAWGGHYRKSRAPRGMYGARRIPVGRYPMMSPRISRICR